jgi:ABC-type transporter Mla maintaining outer membrane lipid asymmetry ATPase subunit MlaF
MIQQGCRTVAEPSADVLLQVKDLRVSYGDRVVLDGLSLSVRKAEI